MEDHRLTEISLLIAEDLWNAGFENFGIVLQSRLNRTANDVQRVFRDTSYEVPHKKIHVRACIGIYNEPKIIATQDRKEMKERMLDMISELFSLGVYVEAATHDPEVIDDVLRLSAVRGIPKAGLEFQVLKGVRIGFQKLEELRAQGYQVRMYLPYEAQQGDAHPYIVRRLKANPRLMYDFVRNMMRKPAPREAAHGH